MPDKTKALLIKNSSTSKAGKRGIWHLFQEAQPYIQGIETNIDKQVDAEVMNSLVSGIPTPWARARLFGFAFPYTQVEANIKKSGLIEFYERLVEEWKGLLACIALFPDRIRVSEPIPMDFKNENPLFNIPPALGRMLFEDEDLWSNPEERKNEPDTRPSIQLIYYAGKLIGATSPYSLVFTAIDYTGLPQTNDMPWYRDGSFVDPLQFIQSNNDQLQKLYLLVANINRNFEAFEAAVNLNRSNKQHLEFDGFKDFLRKWQDELKAAGNNIVDEGTLDAVLNFASPYYSLFNVKQSLFFYKDGRVSFKLREGEEAVEVDPKEILLQEEYIIEFVEEDKRQPLSQSAVNYLKVLNPAFNPREPELEPEHLYFPIPLSEKGMLLFKNQIGDLISSGNEKQHELKCYIKPADYKLVVELHLIIDGKKMNLTQREYEMQPMEPERKVIMWPNFISERWNKYYFYTEFPRADLGTKMVPYFRNAGDQDIIRTKGGKIIYAGDDHVSEETDLDYLWLVSYPSGSLDSTAHKYEILRSNKPFAGLEIRKNIDGEDRVVGYLPIKKTDDTSMGDRQIKDPTKEGSFEPVVVGIDFGSNNSCVHFASDNGGNVSPLTFQNRRVVLVGSEVVDPNNEQIALPNELYFFQNNSTHNGQIKSWVHEHHPQYVLSANMKEQEIAGGVPIFEPNIFIKDMNDRVIQTNAGILHHSMKWLTGREDQTKKTAYLQTAWVKICADLFADKKEPRSLRWSFPGAFSKAEKNQLMQVYNKIVSKCPIQGVRTRVDDPLTEAEAVSNFAINSGASLQSTNLFLGIDVGGSTSDILIIGNDRASRKMRLLKQSSTRMAAGHLVQVIKRSHGFRSTILDFLNDPEYKLRIPNINTLERQPKTAPFFLNSIFDRLKGEQFAEFYSYLARSNPSLFAMPAYITGLLMYYSGQLIAKTIQENEFLQAVNRVDLFPFGKGGRIFDWLDTNPGVNAAQRYLSDCFNSGFSIPDKEITLVKKEEISQDNKSEVAIGLVAASGGVRVIPDENIRDNSDIFGEKGYKFFEPGSNSPVELGVFDKISETHFENLQYDLEMPEKFEAFDDFLNTYLNFVGPKESGILSSTQDLRDSSSKLFSVLKGYITKDPEYKKALSQEDAKFKHSMLIMEGMCFLEEFLVPEIYQND